MKKERYGRQLSQRTPEKINAVGLSVDETQFDLVGIINKEDSYCRGAKDHLYWCITFYLKML